MEEAILLRFGPYVLTEEIYEGADVLLYRGHREPDGAKITVKVPREEYPTARDIARLRHEYSILKDTALPGVVKALGLEKYRNGLALVLADEGGRPLSDVLAKRRFDVGTALRIAISLTGAVGELHRRHVLHKDIKPHNMLVNDALTRVTLFDFGIATRLSHEAQGAIAPTVLEGTVAYFSPEQTGRMNRSIDERTDLYSIGVTLYEMLTGELPFSSTDLLELVHSHIARTPAPPHERAPGVPNVVSAIVMKLLAKAAEDRYQRAEGLRADLARCLAEWEATGTVSPFALGQGDVSDKVRIPEKLYGREAELGALEAAFERVSEGAAELLLIKGAGGVGKSALVSELHKAIARRAGYFVSGKFDAQRGRNTPYAAVARAFGELARQIQADRAEVAERIAERLSRALGPNGQVLLEIIPELEPLLGPQPPAQALGPAEAQALGPAEAQGRLTLALQRALRVLATDERPLVLFLDDLQWADLASLKLLQILLTDPERGHLLVIGASRDNEVDPGHPLMLTLGEIASQGGEISEVTLDPLPRESVRQLAADALGCGEGRAAELADVLFERTGGNPFFVGQLLTALEADGLIAFDARACCLSWDMAAVEERLSTSDVLIFMAGRIRRLGEDVQRVLTLGACIGHEFDLATLATLSGMPLRETAAAIWQALSEGLLVPLDADYRFLDALPGDEEEPAPPSMINGAYRFLHDRVQQAAYGLLDEEARRALHLCIGRRRRGEEPLEARGDDLFDVVRHLNLGAPLITDEEERLDLARGDLLAGRRARRTTAYAAAAEYFTAGIALLPAASFSDHYELAFALHRERAECASLSGEFERAEALFTDLLAEARSRAERADLYTLRALLSLTAGKPALSFRASLDGLALFGLTFPEDPQAQQAMLAERAAHVEASLAGRSLAALREAPAMTDLEQKALLRLFKAVYGAAQVSSPIFALIAVIEMVDLCIEHGPSELSSFAYAMYGFIVGCIHGRYQRGHELCELALALGERFPRTEFLGESHVMTGVVLCFVRPLRSVISFLQRAYAVGFTTGEFHALAYTLTVLLHARFAVGDDLVSVLEEAERGLALMRRTREAVAEAYLQISRQMAACLLGRTKDRLSLDCDDFNAERFLAHLSDVGFQSPLCFFHCMKVQLLFLQEDEAGALEAWHTADKHIAAIAGFPITMDVSFYGCLLFAARLRQATDEDKERYAALAAVHREKVAIFAESCPENAGHRLLLVDAELARARGDHTAAIDLYDQAISAARESGIGRDEALANELAARYHLARGRAKVARVYMTDAYYGYLQWGATAKVEAIAEKHPSLLLESVLARPVTVEPRAVTVRTATRSRGRSSTSNTDALDLEVVMKAAHAIASEIELDKVLDRMMRILAESAGAQRGVLLLDHDGELVVEASISFGPDRVDIGPPARGAAFSSMVVAEVSRTGKPLMLEDARASARFAADPYIQEQQPRSLLCLSMSHQGRRTGVLYLENNAASDAFTPTRVELSSLLAYQAAIAVENARLYAHVQSVTGELQRANEVLESHVQRRTEELRETNERLRVELVERARAEQERAALQEEIIRAQQERLLELSTPIIPITEEIVVMPLIGTMDAARAAQMLETALRGASEARAKMVILDITGIKAMDAAVASTLVQTTSALRLLGTQAAVTGIRPDVAQTLVALGVNLGAVLTFGTLRSGIAYALARSPTGGGPRSRTEASALLQGAQRITAGLAR